METEEKPEVENESASEEEEQLVENDPPSEEELEIRRKMLDVISFNQLYERDKHVEPYMHTIFVSDEDYEKTKSEIQERFKNFNIDIDILEEPKFVEVSDTYGVVQLKIRSRATRVEEGHSYRNNVAVHEYSLVNVNDEWLIESIEVLEDTVEYID
ncbi:hypothetical protein [Lederbergia graminis]|uniref:Nuclear transport factor 2 family protein n=1 Tax=Lederbergia graminis TaxID=735518 RepID=A0ABW0LMF9_9BACI